MFHRGPGGPGGCGLHIEEPVETDSGPIPVTLSIGLVTGHAIGSAVLKGEELLRAADTALYCAKTKGRNRVQHAPEKIMVSQAQAATAQQ